jgi:thiol-disulfide isomerase/thioredoxin
MTNNRNVLLVALLTGVFLTTARAESLGVGDPAPKLDVKSFVKGDVVRGLEPGKLYVVEFWATWCGPCKTSIPHLTELQKKHPEITFIGVSVFEKSQDAVKPFVDEMGDKMAYRVAIDSVPKDAKESEGAMAKTWMQAASQDGIPTAFIINKEAKIAWIGHPGSMDEPLEKIASGSWDLKTAAEEFRKAADDQQKSEKLDGKLEVAMRSGDFKKIVAAVDEIVTAMPSREGDFENVSGKKLAALIKLEEQDKALEYAQKLSKSDLGKSADGLNELAWAIVDPDAGLKPGAKLVQFAVETARRADEMAEGKDAGIADTLAKAYFDSGDVAKAVENQERAVRLAKGSQYEAQIDELKDRLLKYKKAAEKK